MPTRSEYEFGEDRHGVDGHTDWCRQRLNPSLACDCGARRSGRLPTPVEPAPPGAEEVVQTPFGRFLVTRGEIIGETTRAGTLWDGPGFLQPIAIEHGALGTPGVTILDVGANQGAFSIWCALHGAWRVVAVEPVPIVMQRLKANLDLNRERCADIVIPLEVAAYDHTTTLWQPTFDPGNWGGTALLPETAPLAFTIAAAPLDSFSFLYGARVSLIKIDAQGCDGNAIVGLTQTIQRDHPAIVFEWDEALATGHGLMLAKVQQALIEEGYRVDPWPSQPGNFLATWQP